MFARAVSAMALGCLLGGGGARAFGQATPWSNRAPLQIPRQEVAVAAIGSDVYVVGGFGESAFIMDVVERYEQSSNTWSFRAPLPVRAHHAAAAAIDGKLYVVGGWTDFFNTPLDTLYEYDPAADAWTAKAPLPAPAGSPAAVAHGGLLFVAGGFRDGSSVSDFQVYVPSIDAWFALPPMPTPRNHFGLAVVDDRIHAVGGRVFVGHENLDANEAFDLGTVAWTSHTPMPRARSGHAVASVGGFVLAFGGEGNALDPDGIFADVDAYDPVSDQWQPLAPMPTPRHGIGAAVLGTHVHIPGGGVIEGFSVTAKHEVYDARIELGATVPAMGLLAIAFLAATLATLAALRLRHRLSTGTHTAREFFSRTRKGSVPPRS